MIVIRSPPLWRETALAGRKSLQALAYLGQMLLMGDIGRTQIKLEACKWLQKTECGLWWPCDTLVAADAWGFTVFCRLFLQQHYRLSTGNFRRILEKAYLCGCLGDVNSSRCPNSPVTHLLCVLDGKLSCACGRTTKISVWSMVEI